MAETISQYFHQMLLNFHLAQQELLKFDSFEILKWTFYFNNILT